MKSSQRSVHTFSIVAHDSTSGDLGVAVASKFLAVGAVVPWVEAGTGAVATQSYANTSFGPRGLAAMRDGRTLHDIAEALAVADPAYTQRQYGLVNAHGDAYTFTGEHCHAWAGGRTGTGYAAQGNLLAGPQVVDALADTFETRSDLAFPERLLAALLAADRAGGDRRGRQSAALYVARERGGYAGLNDRYIDLRVDDHPDPVAELERLLGLHRLLFERPAENDLLPLDDTVTARLRRVLHKAGGLNDERGPWDDAARDALTALIHAENLEERLVDENRIDRHVLEYLERKYA